MNNTAYLGDELRALRDTLGLTDLGRAFMAKHVEIFGDAPAMIPAQDATALRRPDVREALTEIIDLHEGKSAVPMSIERMQECCKMLRAALRSTPSASAGPQAEAVRPVISVQPMKLSGGRTDYYVSIRVGDREVTPHALRDEQWKAEYEAATYRWLLLGDAKPDLLAYGHDNWPVTAPRPAAHPQPQQTADAFANAAEAAALADGYPHSRRCQPQQADGRGAVRQPIAAALARRLCQLFDSAGESQRSVRARHASAIFQILNDDAPEYLAEQRWCDTSPVSYLEAAERGDRAALSQAPATDGAKSPDMRPADALLSSEGLVLSTPTDPRWWRA